MHHKTTIDKINGILYSLDKETQEAIYQVLFDIYGEKNYGCIINHFRVPRKIEGTRRRR